jgi:peptidoglycan/xylan/chitin deacetylase (PgdA/CDA1 family)
LFVGARTDDRRRRVARLAATALVTALAVAARAAPSIPVLVYHRFDPDKPASMTVRMPVFRAQLDWLKQHHYRIVPLRTALADLAAGKVTAASPEVVITADDGHATVYTELFPLIRAEGLPVTLFIYPSAISNASYALTWDQLRQMQDSGLVDIQSHTYWHPNFKVEKRKRAPADYLAFIDNQLQRSRQVLESRMGRPVDMLAWPFGIVDADLEAAAKRAGYTIGFAYVGGPMKAGDDRLALPRIPAPDIAGDRFGDLLGEMK